MQRLFSDLNIHNELNRRNQATLQEAEALDRHALQSQKVEELAASIANKHAIRVPQLQEDGITRGQVTATGSSIDLYIPFDGDANLFKFQPNSHYLSQQVAAEIQEGFLKLAIPLRNLEPQQVISEANQQISFIRESLISLRNQVDAFHRDLYAEILKKLQERQAVLAKVCLLENALPYPLRPDQPS